MVVRTRADEPTVQARSGDTTQRSCSGQSLARSYPMRRAYDDVVSAAEPTPAAELVVADGGSIPADQLAQLGIRPGTHVRVVATPDRSVGRGLAGSLPDLPDLDWEDFVRASELARHDAERETAGQRAAAISRSSALF